MACPMCYERGFNVSSHQFLYSLLQFYGLELHDLTPLGILHMYAFVTLCEGYMGIEPHFDLWNYFFRARLQQSSDTKAVVLVVWTSSFDLGLELILTSTFRCLTFRSGVGKCGSF
jgi:hypothetical protein